MLIAKPVIFTTTLETYSQCVLSGLPIKGSQTWIHITCEEIELWHYTCYCSILKTKINIADVDRQTMDRFANLTNQRKNIFNRCFVKEDES